MKGPVYGVIEEIGSTSTLLCMVMIGSLIAGNIHWKKLLSVSAYGYCAVRLLGIPLLTFAILRLFHVNPEILGSIVILVSAPAPTLACIMATRYGADKELAAVLVLVSTLLSFVTQPFMAMLCR
jgi:predicted permease